MIKSSCVRSGLRVEDAASMAKIAFITGISGQDGSYLSELLLREGYEVHGLLRHSSSLQNLAHLLTDDRIKLHRGDIHDESVLRRLIAEIRPTEIYHLAGQTNVARSFELPIETVHDVAIATVRLLEIARRTTPEARIFHASSAEIFGNPFDQPQTEVTPMRPINPYGCAKAFATQMTSVYRDSLGLFACNGILYNHESPRRGEHFVTRKIARAAARIARGLERELKLGNIEARRDWGAADDYAKAMWMTLQHGTPGDYIIATGETHSVREFVDAAFAIVGLKADEYLKIDETLLRPSDPAQMIGDAGKIAREVGWKPAKKFGEVVKEMVEAEVKLAGGTP